MNRDPILFRVDGTAKSGWEHLHRCLAFAAALQRRRRPTYFLSRLEPTSLGLAIKRGGSEWLATNGTAGKPADLDETLREIRKLQPAAVIVDAPEATGEYLGGLARTGALVVSLDHLATARFASRLVINPLLGPCREAYQFSRGAQLLLGARYALVRSEIRRIRPLRAQEPAQPYRVLVALGEDDPNGQAEKLGKQLLGIARVERVDVVARAHHPHLEKLQALAAANPDRLEIATEPAQIVSRITRCHMALTAGNGWSLELACVGVPQLVIVQAEPYWPTAQRLEEEGAAVCLGWHGTVSAATIRKAVGDLLDDNLERRSMARCGRKLIDGRGADRMVTALEVMLHRPQKARLAKAA